LAVFNAGWLIQKAMSIFTLLYTYNYSSPTQRPSTARYGKIASFLSDMTGGKLSDAPIETILRKQRGGFVYFFRDRTFNCKGDEPKRPSGCPKLPRQPWRWASSLRWTTFEEQTNERRFNHVNRPLLVRQRPSVTST
jgi:hypothetical protein